MLKRRFQYIVALKNMEEKVRTGRKSQKGATLLEYTIVVIALGSLIYLSLDLLKPQSSKFYSDISDGLSETYPQGYYQVTSQ